MRTPSYVPNLLSSLRIALAPAIFGAAYSNSRIGFSLLLGVVVVTDTLDGRLARWWAAESTFGRRLDRWGDGLAMVLGAVGVNFLWPGIVEREWVWMLVALAGYVMVGLQRLIVRAADAGPPAWWATALGWAVPLSLVPLLAEWAAWPFQVAAVLQAGVGGCKLSAGCARRLPHRADATGARVKG